MNYAQYLPVDPDFYDILEKTTKENREQKVFFFLSDNTIDQIKGEYKEIENRKDGKFLTLKNETRARLDRIITINGKPGPAFDEYDSYSNACLSCQAGYDD